MTVGLVLRDTLNVRSRCVRCVFAANLAQGRARISVRLAGLQNKRDFASSNTFRKRQRRDDFWIPTVSLKHQDEAADATQLLIRAGYVRQAYSGIYHMLPLGLRVLNKLEALIDRHMRSISASKVSLSSISSQNLWKRSGRLDGGSEFFKFADRHDAKWLLAPTHEEEITTLVRESVHSPGQLPVRLYQISRKYRDEKRPRGGLLRGKEFIMKDLYTFDLTQSAAHSTYDQVRQAYRNILIELNLPYIEARADSGNMGGSLSHEYHFTSAAGEDDVINCNLCDYARNEEWVPSCSHQIQEIASLNTAASETQTSDLADLVSECFIDKPRKSLVKIYAPATGPLAKPININTYAVKAACKSVNIDLDTGVEQPEQVFTAVSDRLNESPGTVYYLFDPSISSSTARRAIESDQTWLSDNRLDSNVITTPAAPPGFSLLKQASGDSCPQCETGKLTVQKTIEIGHTFHLGTRYSSKLDLTVKPSTKDTKAVTVEMGCHGIGVSRMIAAIASALSDSKGLMWPAAIAPYQVVIVTDKNESEQTSAAEAFYDSLIDTQSQALDVILDDRADVKIGYKLKDADFIGYPIIIVFGKSFKENGQVEVQCRRKDFKEFIDLNDATRIVKNMVRDL